METATSITHHTPKSLLHRLDFDLIALAYIALVLIGLYEKPVVYTYMTGLLGAVIGAVVGILSPPHGNEGRQFGEYGKVISGFFAGFVVSKFDRIFETVMSRGAEAPLLTTPFLFRFAYFATALVLTTLFVFAYRRYEEER